MRCNGTQTFIWTLRTTDVYKPNDHTRVLLCSDHTLKLNPSRADADVTSCWITRRARRSLLFLGAILSPSPSSMQRMPRENYAAPTGFGFGEQCTCTQRTMLATGRIIRKNGAVCWHGAAAISLASLSELENGKSGAQKWWLILDRMCAGLFAKCGRLLAILVLIKGLA